MKPILFSLLILTALLTGCAMPGSYHSGMHYDIETGSYFPYEGTKMHIDPLTKLEVKDGWHYEAREVDKSISSNGIEYVIVRDK